VNVSETRPRLLLSVPLLAAVITVVACSPLAVVNSASPNRYYERYDDLAYGDQPRQTLDLYTANNVRDGAPVVVFFYGGGWRNGRKENYEFVASALTEAGITVVIPDYRLHPDVSFPAFVEDGATAYAWTVSELPAYGRQTDNVFVMGHSAGAHIAASLSLDGRYLERESLSTESISGFIGLSGPYDFLPIKAGYLEAVFPEDVRAQSQPIHFVSNDAPPTLLIHGEDDGTVLIDNSKRLAARLREAGVFVELTTYSGVGHARVVAALAPPLDFLGETLEDTLRFIDSVVLERRRDERPRAMPDDPSAEVRE
jgi:acetyl esterase/lipase